MCHMAKDDSPACGWSGELLYGSPKEKRASSDFLILSNEAGIGENDALQHLLDQLGECEVNSFSYGFGYTWENEKIQGPNILNSTLIQITVKASSQKLQRLKH